MPDTPAPSTATPVDAKEQGSGNLTQGQAAAQLFAEDAKKAEAHQAQVASGEKPPEASAEAVAAEATPNAPDAEANTASVETEETEPAADETTEPAQPETPADPDVHSQSTSLTPEQQKLFDKRIGKEVGKRQAAEARLAKLEAMIAATPGAAEGQPAAAEQAQPAPVAPLPTNQPLGHIHDLGALGALQAQAKQAIRWTEETLDTAKAWKTRIDTDPDTGEETSTRVTTIGDRAYTEAEVKGILRQAKVTLEDYIPQRAQFVNAREHATKVARQEFGFLTDKTTPEYAQAQAILRDPWLQQRPDAEWIAAVQVRGLAAMAAEKAAKTAKTTAKPKVAAPKAPSDQAAVSSTASPARVPVATGNRQALATEEQRLRNKGGITTAEAIASLTNRERLRNSR